MLIKEDDGILSHFQFDNKYLRKSLNKQIKNFNEKLLSQYTKANY